MTGSGTFFYSVNMKIYPKVLLLSLMFFFVASISCDRDESQVRKIDQTFVARYRASVYSKPGSAERGDWVATLEKGEEIKVSELIPPPGKQADEVEIENLIAHAELADGKTGYLERKHLAKDSAVILSDDLHLYKRPSITSGIGSGEENIKRGIVAFIDDEDYNNGDWIEISGGSRKEKSYFKGWARKDPGKISTDTALVVSAIRLEQYIEELGSDKENIRNRAIEGLDSLMRTSSPPISEMAREALRTTGADLDSEP